MRKHIFLVSIVTCLIVGCLTGCSVSQLNADLFRFDQLKTAEGVFQYREIPFGSSYKEVSDVLHLEHLIEGSVKSLTTSYYSDKFDFYGVPATFWLDFEDNQLVAVQITFQLPDGSEPFEQMVQDLTQLYGEGETSTGNSHELFSSTIYKWNEQNTFLNAVLIDANSNMSGSVGVFCAEE